MSGGEAGCGTYSGVCCGGANCWDEICLELVSVNDDVGLDVCEGGCCCEVNVERDEVDSGGVYG